MRQYDYFYIRTTDNEILGHYYTNDSDRCYRVFKDIDERYKTLSFEAKEQLFFSECKKQGIEIHIFNNCDRYTY